MLADEGKQGWNKMQDEVTEDNNKVERMVEDTEMMERDDAGQ